jgi:hypothetical protein
MILYRSTRDFVSGYSRFRSSRRVKGGPPGSGALTVLQLLHERNLPSLVPVEPTEIRRWRRQR